MTTDHTLESQADAIERLEGRRRQLMADLDLATNEQATMYRQIRQLIKVLNKYHELDMATFSDPLCYNEDLEEMYRDLRDMDIVNVVIPEHVALKKYLVRYIIGTTYDVYIEAGDDIEARFKFEEMYDENNGEIPTADEGEVTHEIDEVVEI